MGKRDLLALVGFIVLSFAAAGFGALFTTPAVSAGGWYSQIQKPTGAQKSGSPDLRARHRINVSVLRPAQRVGRS